MPQAIGVAVGSLLFTVGAPLAVVNFFAVGAGGSLLFGASLLALNTALQSSPSQRISTVGPSEGQATSRQAVPPRTNTIGEGWIAGPLWLFDTDPSTGLLYLGHILKQGPTSEILMRRINDRIVEVDGSGVVTTAPYADPDAPVTFEEHLGLPTETAYDLESVFNLADMRGDGVTTALVTVDDFDAIADQVRYYSSGAPSIAYYGKWQPLFDPRDPAQDPHNETTWTFSRNVARGALTYMLRPEYGADWATEILPNLDEWIEAINVCDEDVPLAAGGTEKRYETFYTYRLTGRPADILSRFEDAMDGRIWAKADGTYGIIAGKFYPPTVTLGPSDIVGVTAMAFGTELLDDAGGVKAQWVSAEDGSREMDVEPWPSAAIVAALDERRTRRMDLTHVPSRTQARRLMKREYVRANTTWQGTLLTNLGGLKALDKRFINANWPELGIDESFEVIRWMFDPVGRGCRIVVRAIGATIDDWDKDTEEGDAGETAAVFRWVEKNDGTVIGDMSQSGGLAAAFDGNRSQTTAASARSGNNPGYVGKTWASPKKFGKASIAGSTDDGLSGTGGGSNAQLRVWCKNGTAPTDSTGCTLVADTGLFADPNDETPIDVLSNGLYDDTAWLHWLIEVSNDGSIGGDTVCAEADLWELM